MFVYREAMSAMGLSTALQRCAAGDVEAPIINFASPADWYSFPPALVPVWSDGSGPEYWGYWKHWFVDRPPLFVRMHVEGGRHVYEIAKTDLQFFTRVALLAIVTDDGITPELQAFCERVGVTNLDEIDSVSLENGDRPEGLLKLRQFESYEFDLPIEPNDVMRKWNSRVTTGEIRGGMDLSDFEQSPWLGLGSDKPALFDRFLKEGALDLAWLTLNSHGWTIRAAKAAIDRLRLEANDPAFTLLVRAWRDIADESSGAY
jgi:hypothetical protein